MMFKQYIIWSQSSTTNGDDLMLVDGEKIPDDKRHKYFSFLIDTEQTMANGKKHVWKPVSLANALTKLSSQSVEKPQPTLKVFRDNMGNTMVQSHCVDLDTKGRKIVYICCSKSVDGKVAVDILEEALTAIGRTGNKGDFDFLRHFSLKKNHYWGKIFIIIILICLTLIILSKLS